MKAPDGTPIVERWKNGYQSATSGKPEQRSGFNTDIAQLIEELSRCEAAWIEQNRELDRLRTALMFYAKREHYPLAIAELAHFELLKDFGKRARKVLEGK